MNKYKIFKDIKSPSYATNYVMQQNIPAQIPQIQQLPVIKENFQMPAKQNFQPHVRENFQMPAKQNFQPHVRENFQPQIKENLVFHNKSKGNYTTSHPSVFGPPLWFSLHNAAAHYPDNPAPLARERMKNIILALPILIPCKNCQEHATAYIEKNYNDLDRICSSRDAVFKFFVDFHNHVNVRYDKPEMSYEDAYKLYLGGVNLSPINYS